jgi:hypothetical protein
MLLVVAAAVSFVLAVILLLHHGYKHSKNSPENSIAQNESCAAVCYFQPSDVCNFRTCNHETWILLFCFIGVACLCAHAA